MEIQKILENLCVYDKRNPDYDVMTNNGEWKKQKDCYCDNCFYGRTQLAEELLKYIKTI